MSKTRIFLPIRKVDEEQRLVYGEITGEVLDKSGEVMDYEGSKPYFTAWSGNIEKTSGGKSKGNVRVMHTNKVAGILTDIVFNDEGKNIEACAKVIDDGEWAMVLAGGYTGFSIGGRYVKRWKDGDVNRFIADPVEVSLVDNPCVPSATFSYMKADGVEEEVAFQIWAPTNDEIAAHATELAKTANDGTTWTDHIETAKEELVKAKAQEDEEEDDKEVAEEEDEADPKDKKKSKKKPAVGDAKEEAKKDEAEEEGKDGEEKPKKADFVEGLAQVWKCTDGTTFDKKADAAAHQTTLDAGEEVHPLTKGLQEVRELLDGNTNAGVELETATQVRAAWYRFSKTDHADTILREQIEKAWVEHIGEDTAPPSLDLMIKLGDLDKAMTYARALDVEMLAKGMYTVSHVGRALAMFEDIATSVVHEENWEKDADSKLPQQASDILAAIATFLVEMVTEETAEVLARLQDINDGNAELNVVVATGYIELADVPTMVKADEALMAKVGARNSKGDAAKIQTLHDHAVSLGATCGSEKTEKLDGGDDLQKRFDEVQADRDRLAKVVDEAVPAIAAMKKDIETLKAQPMPAAPRTHVVTKGADNGGAASVDNAGPVTIDTLLAKYTPDELAQAAIRISQRQPVSMTRDTGGT